MGDRHSRGASVLRKASTNVLNSRQAQFGGSGIEPSEYIIRNVADQNVTHNPMISHDIGAWSVGALIAGLFTRSATPCAPNRRGCGGAREEFA